MAKYKTINISPESHKKLAVWCAENEQSITRTVEKMILSLVDGTVIVAQKQLDMRHDEKR